VCDTVCYGLDFGFNHPNAMVKVGVHDDKVYVEELIYESKLTTDELVYLIKTLGINKSHEIYCDSARPDTIEEMQRSGLRAVTSDKSVWDGIQMVKSKQLYITKNSINLLKELKSYKWRVDKNGRVLEEPVKFRDDLVDAMRYAIYTMFTKQLNYDIDGNY
jgi:phage terminase large subunit